MKRSVLGALLILLLGCGAVTVWYFLRPMMAERRRLQTSDARATTAIDIGGDGYLGYWFLTSPELRKQAARAGLLVTLEDDGGAYAERLERFARGDYEAIVLPVSSYLVHGARHDYPGVIVAAISESKGADGILGVASRFPRRSVEELGAPGLRVVYTADSPSEFLLDLTCVGFEDLAHLVDAAGWRVEVAGPREVLERARRRDGDAFVLWEPELSRALDEVPGLVPVWGSDGFAGYIVDVIVFRRDFLVSHENDVVRFLEAYFRALSVYASQPDQMQEEMRGSTGLRREVLASMLPKIDWFDLHENCLRQFGLSPGVGAPATDGVVDCILQCSNVLVRAKRLERAPVADPYSIVNSRFLEVLRDSAPAALGRDGGLALDFAPLSEEGWARQREVGTMRIEPISFQAGRNLLDEHGEGQVDAIAKQLVNNYPSYRIAVRGHTGPGDEAANLELSRERAQAVAQRLIAVHAVDPDRVRAEGRGAGEPPSRKPGESERAFLYRLPRVEFVLLGDNRL
jgi:outer membrane protein OmpA-like peptidoglycan-associated protein/ABC-type nitrate/sulfonate/bicarbonate transport system substrate-binding protein